MKKKIFENDKISIDKIEEGIIPVYEYHGAVLVYCVQGECHIGEEKLVEGQVFILSQKHAILEVKKAEVFVITFFPTNFKECIKELWNCPHMNKKLENSEGVAKRIEKLIDSSKSTEWNVEFKIIANIYELVYIITSDCSYVENRREKDIKSTYERMEAINGYITEHWNENLTLSELAKMNNYSVSAMSRFFKKNFNMNFSEYYNDIRLSRAKKELVFSELSITEIAVKCGFSNLRSFQRIFFQKNRITASEYRKKKVEE